MTSFQIKEQFYLDDQPLRLRSGALHYFRIHPSQWSQDLFNLRALGCNTVETYVPWNLHEPQEGRFDFKGIKDLFHFLDLAQEQGLYVILRPSPYICAEWDFGGLPAWLLAKPKLRVRSTDQQYLMAVQRYYHELLPRLQPYQIDQGGPILMMQVENEYGSYGNEHGYLRQLVHLMRREGISVPLFTADGAWDQALDSGSLIGDDIFVTGNFGADVTNNFENLAQYFARNQRKWPLMCMEYWDGWFDQWGKPINKRPPKEVAADVTMLAKRGSFNLYMFRGGTNFGFMNGCLQEQGQVRPQTTSYDYDALLDEAGNPTAKYFAVQEALAQTIPGIEQAQPRLRAARTYGEFAPDGVLNLEQATQQLTRTPSQYPLSMAEIGSGYGYLYYQTELINYHHPDELTLVGLADRAQVLINGETVAVQEEADPQKSITYSAATGDHIQLGILVENLGRINYGSALSAPSQAKGLVGGVQINNHYQSGWTQTVFDFTPEMLGGLVFAKATDSSKLAQPQLTHFTVALAEIDGDTYLDCSAWGKGCVSLNGVNLGRYWHRGPYQTLYIPAGLLKQQNEFVVFETEGRAVTRLILVEHPKTCTNY